MSAVSGEQREQLIARAATAIENDTTWRDGEPMSCALAAAVVDALGATQIGTVQGWGGGLVDVFVGREVERYPANGTPLFTIAALEVEK